MALNTNVLLNEFSGSIQSSVLPLTTSQDYPVGSIVSGEITNSWQYYQNGELLDFPVWAIIDLGFEATIKELELHGKSFLWEGGSCPKTFQISIAKDFTRTPRDNDFDVVWATSLEKPTHERREVRRVQAAESGVNQTALTWGNVGQTAIEPRVGRYVKISVDSAWDNDAGWVGIATVRVYGRFDNFLETMTSDALIGDPPAPPIFSDAQITITPVQGIDTSLLSNTLLAWASGPNGPTVAEAEALSPGYITYMREMQANAKIIDSGQEMNSNGTILASETVTILSDASLSRTATFALAMHVAYPGSGSLSILEGQGYSPDLFEQRLIAHSTLETTSVGTIVADMFTSDLIDLSNVQPPFGYPNYDWSYDWVVRTYNQAIYTVETRIGETPDEVNLAIFSVKELGHRFERGKVPRYHQYRLHVWASGSGDFEFHQFTVRGHVVHGANKYYESLIQDPFLTTNVVNLDISRTWEPDLNKAILWPKDYIPGDVTSSGRVTGDDIIEMVDVLFGGGTALDTRTLDVNGDGVFTSADIIYLGLYISGSGPPPRVVPE